MDSIQSNEASASAKRKACLNSVAMPKKAVKVISISPPESQKQSLSGILLGLNRDKVIQSPTFGCIDCRVSRESTYPHSNMTGSSIFAISQTSFEAELATNHYMASESWITDDRLLVRTQSWIYAHNLEPESKEYVQSFLNGDHLPAYEKNQLTSWACRHLITGPNRHIFDFANPEEAAKIRRCEEGALEYRFDIVKTIPVNWTLVSSHPIGDAFCAVVTVYRDFGRCLTPYDPRWAAHFVEYEFSGFTGDFPADNQILRNPAEEECATDWELGGIMKAFEGTDEIVAIELSLHESVLKNMLSTEESRKREVEEKRRMDLEKQRWKKEELERQLNEEEQKEKSLRKTRTNC